MRDSQRKEHSYSVAQGLSISTVKLGDAEEDQCQKNVLEAVNIGFLTFIQPFIHGYEGDLRVIDDLQVAMPA
jgi:hypothetical protein